jgi:hypothetical protein
MRNRASSWRKRLSLCRLDRYSYLSATIGSTRTARRAGR